MQVLLKTVYWTSILLLSFWVLTSILLIVLPIEITNDDYAMTYRISRFFGIPITILLTLTGTIKREDTARAIVSKVFTTILLSSLIAFIIAFLALLGMCGETTREVYFENKKHPSTKIVRRSFGCGATDSSPDVIRLRKVVRLTSYLIWVTNIDTTQINKSEWIRVK
jgi:hypothetical protein